MASPGQLVGSDEYMSEVPVGIDANMVFYDTTKQVVRGKQPFFVGVKPNLVTGIPVGTTALVGASATPVVIEDGTLELEVDYAETVNVTLVHPHYVTRILEVACEAQG
jgi:hypothetical protein